MTTLEVLADPVRLRIVRRLAQNAPASLPQLAEAAGVHRNTLRPHIEELEDAGLIVRAETEPAGRGRPPIRYRLDDGWKPFWVDTLPVESRATERIAFLADNPGKWAIDTQAIGRDGAGLAGWFEVT